MNVLILFATFVTAATVGPALIQIWRDHPRALLILAFVEMWERFSYYGMRSLLILFLGKHLLLDDTTATAQFASFSTLVYLLPLIGGFVADRIIGMRRAVMIGGALLILGHGLLTIEGPPGRQLLRIDQQRFALEPGAGPDRGNHVVVDGRSYRVEHAADGALRLVARDGPRVIQVPNDRYAIETAERPAIFGAILYLALAAVALGIGLVKSNISALVGRLYAADDPRRDAGFTLYFYGVNLGAFWAAAVCGWLGLTVGWWAGFGAASVGMAIGLIGLVLGRGIIDRSIPPDTVPALQEGGPPTAPAGWLDRRNLIACAGLLALLPLAAWLIPARVALGAGLAVAIAVAVGYALLEFLRSESAAERRNLIAIAAMILAATVFYIAFQQSGSSVVLFSARHIDLTLAASSHSLALPWGSIVFGPDAAAATGGDIWIDSRVTAPQLLALNAGFVILLAPLSAGLWARLARFGRDPGIATKFGLALLQVGLCFLVIVAAKAFASSAFLLPIWVMVLHSVLHTTAELCLAPVGQSRVSKLAPARLLGFFMASWLLASAIAQYAGGYLAGLAATGTIGGDAADPQRSFEAAMHLFGSLGWTMTGIGMLVLAAAFVIHRQTRRNNKEIRP